MKAVGNREKGTGNGVRGTGNGLRGAGKEHGERENEKWQHCSPFSNFIPILCSVSQVPRSPCPFPVFIVNTLNQC